MARYPYHSKTASYIKEHGPSLADLNIARVYQSVRERGKQRVLEVLKNNAISDRAVISESEALQEILSYVVTRILVSCANDFYLIRKYALAEAVLMNDRLQNESTEVVLAVAEELGVSAGKEDSGAPTIKIHVTDYLRHSTGFKSDEWKLVNQDLKNGQVLLNNRRFIRVLQNALRVKIESELPLPVNDEIIKSYGDEVNEIKSLVGSMKKSYEVKDFGKLDLGRLPPCLKQILAMMQAGENLPHIARFSITAFLHTVGVSVEEILKLFGQSPDFDPSIARYQIEHISGAGSGTEYVPPGCGKMKSYGICYNPDRLCAYDWMNHPLTYYRVKGEPRKGGLKENEKRRKNSHW